jgi:hypothetical protein
MRVRERIMCAEWNHSLPQESTMEFMGRNPRLTKPVRLLLEVLTWLRRFLTFALVALILAGLLLPKYFHGLLFINLLWVMTGALVVDAIVDFSARVTAAFRFRGASLHETSEQDTWTSRSDWETSLIFAISSVVCATIAAIFCIVSFAEFHFTAIVFILLAAGLLTAAVVISKRSGKTNTPG